MLLHLHSPGTNNSIQWMFRFYVEQLKTKFLVRCVRSFTDSSLIVGRPYVSLGHQPGQAFLELELDNEQRRGRSAVARRDWYQQQFKTHHNNNQVGRCTRTHRYPSSGPGGDHSLKRIRPGATAAA